MDSLTIKPPTPVGDAPDEVARLLQRWSQGDKAALARMLPLVYEELRRIAQRHLRREREDHALERTGLVHEAYLRLAQQGPLKWESKAHFCAWVSTLMRHILIDHARSLQAAKRGGGAAVLSLDAMQDAAAGSIELPLPQAPPDSLGTLHVSAATVKRELATARAWLLREMGRLRAEQCD